MCNMKNVLSWRVWTYWRCSVLEAVDEKTKEFAMFTASANTVSTVLRGLRIRSRKTSFWRRVAPAPAPQTYLAHVKELCKPSATKDCEQCQRLLKMPAL